MFRGWTWGRKDTAAAPAPAAGSAVNAAIRSESASVPAECKTLLVIEGQDKDWAPVFAGATVTLQRKPKPVGIPGAAAAGNSDSDAAAVETKDVEAVETKTFSIKVVQTAWDCIDMVAYSKQGVVASIRPTPLQLSRGKADVKIVRPDFVLVRNVARGVLPHQDYRKVVYGFMYGGVPSINSWESILMSIERPVVHAQLLAMQRKFGPEAFPVIDQAYYPNHREMMFSPDFPVVMKVGHAQAGMGKMILEDHHAFADFATVMAVTDNYCTAEPFLTGEYDLRIQKVGDTYRAFKRTSMCGNWKTNMGTSVVESIELTPQYKLWVDEASKCFGGMEITTVDAIHTADGKEFILEFNDTASGFLPDCEAEDNLTLKALVLAKMENTLYW